MDVEEIELILSEKVYEILDCRYANLKPSIKKYLIKIEECIQLKEKEKKDILKNYKETTFNILSISKEINISRQTIYNNSDLEKYILKRQQEFEKQDLMDIIQRKDEELKRLNETIYKLQMRDLNEQLLLDKIEKYKQSNKDLIKEINILNKQNNAFLNENRLLKKLVESNNVKVLNITKEEE